jgi:16S rRNA (cytidine1402-2'-O)-methyltransferase
VQDTLSDLLEALGERRACLARELTKVHETFLRGTLPELRAQLEGQEVLGEVVLLVEGRTGSQRWSEDELRRALSEGLARGEKLKTLSTELAARAGWTGNEVYRLGLDVKGRG